MRDSQSELEPGSLNRFRDKNKRKAKSAPFKGTNDPALSAATTMGIANCVLTARALGWVTVALLVWFQPASSFRKPRAVLGRARGRIAIPAGAGPAVNAGGRTLLSCGVSFKGLSSQKMPLPPSLPLHPPHQEKTLVLLALPMRGGWSLCFQYPRNDCKGQLSSIRSVFLRRFGRPESPLICIDRYWKQPLASESAGIPSLALPAGKLCQPGCRPGQEEPAAPRGAAAFCPAAGSGETHCSLLSPNRPFLQPPQRCPRINGSW